MTYEEFMESVIAEQGISLSDMNISDKQWINKKNKVNSTLKITEQNLRKLIFHEVNKTIQAIEKDKNV
jgi:HD superfamily phosphohydrolase YqeK